MVVVGKIMQWLGDEKVEKKRIGFTDQSFSPSCTQLLCLERTMACFFYNCLSLASSAPSPSFFLLFFFSYSFLTLLFLSPFSFRTHIGALAALPLQDPHTHRFSCIDGRDLVASLCLLNVLVSAVSHYLSFPPLPFWPPLPVTQANC
jgi:hypothetical protein